MKIVSLNIWDLPVGFVRDRKERLLRICNFFHDLDPDVICLQESFDPRHRVQFNHFFSEKGYVTSDPKPASRNILGRKIDTTGGLVTYSRFPLVSVSFSAFKKPWFSPIEYLAAKGALITFLETPFGSVQVINTHLSKVLCGERVRKSQLKHVLQIAKMQEPIPTLIVGDFNQHDLFRNPKFADLISAHNFTHADHANDALTYRIENKYVDIWMNKITRSQQLDYIFSAHLDKARLEVRDYTVLYSPEPLSDHDPVLLALQSSV